MATEIGTGTSYPITVPVGSDNADIQTALRYITYGIAGTPNVDSQITNNSIFGKMKFLAPKFNPEFTGNGSIAGDFSVGGDLKVSGTIDTLMSTTASFKDKVIVIGSENTTDAEADISGLAVKGATDKQFFWINGTGWQSSESINIASNTNSYSIAGIVVLSKDQVLGKTIGGTSTGDIVSIDGVQTLTNKTISTVSTGSTGSGLVQAPQMVISRSSVTPLTPAPGTWTANVFAAGNDILSSLEAAKTYTFRLKYFVSITRTVGDYTLTLPLVFSNAPSSIKYTFRTYPQNAGSVTTRQGMGTTVNILPLAGSSTASEDYVVEVEGYFNTHATLSSTFTPTMSMQVSSSNGASATVQIGSYIEIQKIGASTQTNIAGNWA